MPYDPNHFNEDPGGGAQLICIIIAIIIFWLVTR